MVAWKKLRKLAVMAKNRVKRGRSARNGNKPAPYTKYGKMPYNYQGTGYENYHLEGGILYRGSERVVRRDITQKLQAAE